MRLLPVIDLRGGQVVRAVAGRRSEYAPLVSTLACGAAPGDVALALRTNYGFNDAYVADLGAIESGRPDVDAWRAITSAGLRLWIDAGLRTVADVERAQQADDELRLGSMVAGLESLGSVAWLAGLVERFTATRLVFSLDLKAGQPLLSTNTSTRQDWSRDPLEIVAQAIGVGVRRLLVLDLARVGTAAGLGTEPLLRAIRARHPEIEVAAGGGVSDSEDLHRLASCGCDVALVASALHNGQLTPADVAAFNH